MGCDKKNCFDREYNAEKYGTPGDDVISGMVEVNRVGAFGFCLGNSKKYITRFLNTTKNEDDLKKALDYIDRMIMYL